MNSILRYKGYSARPEYSADDQVFYGKILGIDDLVDFYTENAKEIEKEFRAAVDDYLEFCEEVGKQPQKAFSGTFNVRRAAPEGGTESTGGANLAESDRRECAGRLSGARPAEGSCYGFAAGVCKAIHTADPDGKGKRIRRCRCRAVGELCK